MDLILKDRGKDLLRMPKIKQPFLNGMLKRPMTAANEL